MPTLFILSLFLFSRTEFSSAGTRKAFREIRSQKCMWVNNVLQFGKGHPLSSTEINITGVWKAMLRAHWEPNGDRHPARPGLQSYGPLTTCQELLNDTFFFFFCIPSATDLLAHLSSPSLCLQIGNKPHLCQNNFSTISFPSNPRI